MTTVTVYHNPKCSTSRNVLQLLRDNGVEPTIVEYLKTPLSRADLAQLAQTAGADSLLRRREPLAAELGLMGAGVSDDAILDAIARHPILLNRPIVVGRKGAIAARPIERALEVL